MSKLLIFDFVCTKCGHSFEEMQEIDDHKDVPCTNCQDSAIRTISGTRIDPGLGVSTSFPSMAAKWDKKQRQRSKIDNIERDNLWMH